MEELPFSNHVPCMYVYLKVNFTHKLVSVCILSNTSLHWMKNMEVEFMIVSFHILREDLVVFPFCEHIFYSSNVFPTCLVVAVT